MKKLIVLSVVFALVAGTAFAVDLGGTVFGNVGLLKSGDDISGSAGFGRLRFEGSGDAGDGKFGGWLRLGDGTSPEFHGMAWWKPIDQFKLTIGGNPDGFWGKEGVTGWMFNQMAYDSGVAAGSNNIWGWGETVSSLQTRFAFYGGYGDNGLLLEIKPVDMLGINIALPYFKNAKLEDIFKNLVAQVDLNLDFGNIAVTYNGEGPFGNGVIHAYFGGSFGDLGLDVGLAYHLSDGDAKPLFAGLGLKYGAGAFGVKLRTAFGIPLSDGDNFGILVDLLPYYAFNDSVSAFLNAGFGLSGADSDVGWFVNPYLRVGAEWGPTFYAGFRLAPDGDDISWSVPVSIMVSF